MEIIKFYNFGNLNIFKIFASPTKYSNQKNVLDAAEAAALKETKCLEEVRNC